MQSYKQSAGLRDLFGIIFKHKKKIIFIFLAVSSITAIVTLLLPPTYEAKSNVLIKVGREHIYRAETGDLRPSIFFTPDGAVSSEIQIMTSRDLISRVVTAIGPEKMYGHFLSASLLGGTPMESAVSQFEKDLKVEQKPRADVISVIFSHSDPKIAAQSVNLLIDYFRDQHLKVFRGPVTAFLEQQVAFHEKRLRESEQQIEDYKQKNRIFALEEQRATLLRQRTDLDTSMLMAQNEIKQIQLSGSGPAGMGRSPEQQASIDAAKARLLELQLKEEEILRKYNEDTQIVAGIRQEVKVVKDFITEQEKFGDNLEKSRTRAAIKSQEAKIANIATQITALDAAIRDINLREREWQNLKRDFAMNETNYQTSMRKLEEARISDEMDAKKMANISVLQTATVPSKPVRPDVGKNIMLGMLFGAVAGFGLAFVSEYSAQGASSPEIARRRLGLPVLLTLPYKE
ncbi:MAG: Wzz/FepE/Etk N-terminal domain-containing protein [Syntrophaceae bacterium]